MSTRPNGPTDLDQEVSNRIRTIRMQRGLSLKEVADKVGLVFQQYHKFETGLLRVSAGLLIALADALNCEVADFIPPELRGEKTLDLNLRLDMLKHEIVDLVRETQSEETLLALKTLLAKQSDIEAKSVSGTTG